MLLFCSATYCINSCHLSLLKILGKTSESNIQKVLVENLKKEYYEIPVINRFDGDGPNELDGIAGFGKPRAFGRFNGLSGIGRSDGFGEFSGFRGFESNDDWWLCLIW